MLYISINQDSCRNHDERKVSQFALTCCILRSSQQTADTKYHEDAPYKVQYIKFHTSNTSSLTSSKLIGKPSQGQTILMESHPEEDNHSEYQTEANDALLGLSRTHLLNFLRLLTILLLVRSQHLLISLLTQEVNQDGNDDRYTSHGKCEVIRVCLSVTEVILCPSHDGGCCCWSKQGTNVDSHIEERETRVTMLGIFRIIVEVTYHHLKVTFKETSTQTYKQQRCSHSSHSYRSSTQRYSEEEIA